MIYLYNRDGPYDQRFQNATSLAHSLSVRRIGIMPNGQYACYGYMNHLIALCDTLEEAITIDPTDSYITSRPKVEYHEPLPEIQIDLGDL
jgi:hypothetical protein